jgi:RimJ/RimL family protein N-acetyltransferase
VTADSITLKGGKVILREKRSSDAVNDYQWRTDPEMAELDATLPLRMDFEQFKRLYEDELRHGSPWARRFAIDTPQGQQIGNVMYYDADFVKGQAELGILIGERKYLGKGYGTDAVNLLLHHIFMTTPLERVYLHTLEWNERAQRSFTKSGFQPLHTVKRSGHAFLLMEIKRERWIMLQEQAQPKEPDLQAGASTPR